MLFISKVVVTINLFCSSWFAMMFMKNQLFQVGWSSIQGGEPDLTTAAKMVLHDWQRGRLPFFVPPPRVEDESEEPNYGVDDDSGVESNQAAAAFKAIANVISSQQQRSVPVQRDLFSDNELNGEASDQILVSEDELQAHPSETEGKTSGDEDDDDEDECPIAG